MRTHFLHTTLLHTYRFYRPVLTVGAVLAACFTSGRVQADRSVEPAQNAAVTSQFAAPAPSYLQVTGTTNRFNVSASHADALSVLKAVFEQAHQQFVPDSSVNGEVTLALSGQPFSVVLASICKQTFLRYEIDKNGIYQFQRDAQALRDSFARMRAINGIIADQLRRMGYPLPMNGQAANGLVDQQYGAGGRFGGQGFGGGGGTVGRDQESTFRGRGGLSGGGQPEGSAGPDNTKQQDLKGDRVDKADVNRRATSKPIPQSNSQSSTGRAYSAYGDQVAEPLSPYEQLLRDNGLVGVHIPKEQPLPITEVLKQLSRQANVPILVDPQLQSEHLLKFWGNIVRPLPDVLNLLLPAMRLEWRYSGGTIFVTETPDFGVFYGISNIPKVIYPPAGLLPESRGVQKTPQRSQ